MPIRGSVSENAAKPSRFTSVVFVIAKREIESHYYFSVAVTPLAIKR